MNTIKRPPSASRALASQVPRLPRDLLDPQIVGEREADIKHLQEQLTAANQANGAGQAAQGGQNQSSQSAQASDAKAAGDVSQAQQEEVAGLRQEVPALTD